MSKGLFIGKYQGFNVYFKYDSAYGNLACPWITVSLDRKGIAMTSDFTDDETLIWRRIRKAIEKSCTYLFKTNFCNWVDAGNGANWKGEPTDKIPDDIFWIAHCRPRGYTMIIDEKVFTEENPTSWVSMPPKEAWVNVDEESVTNFVVKPFRNLFVKNLNT